ncbi:MAG: homoserine kinase [Acidilobaceae archaeon]
MGVRVRAYCSSANLGSGFDILAISLNSFYDEVEVEVYDGSGNIRIIGVYGPYANSVPSNSDNIIVYAARKLLSRFNISNVNVDIRLWKGIPVSSGLGSSGASSVAVIKALSEALNLKLDSMTIAELGGLSEEFVAGDPHFDNSTASAVGGLVILVSNKPPIKARRLNTNYSFILSVPSVKPIQGKTRVMREVLPKSINLRLHVESMARLASLIYGLIYEDDYALSLGLDDVIVEPARSKFIPCYDIIREYSRKAGAIGSVISGAGPSMLTVTRHSRVTEVIRSLERAYRNCGIEATIVQADIAPGAHIVGGD